MAIMKFGETPIQRGTFLALLAAFAFGATTPFIQKFGTGIGPFPVAALLYAGAALTSIRWFRSDAPDQPVRRKDIPRLLLVATFGALIAPVAFAWGVQHTSATSASLLLNFEAVATVILAWLLFREPIGGRVIGAVLAMVAGAVVLVVPGGTSGSGIGWGGVAVAAASTAWALDNTLAKPLSDLAPTQVVFWKGILGATVSAVLAFCFHQPFPSHWGALALLACGAAGYGLSLRLYLLAQRRLGAARTGSIFAFAPFIGASVAWALGERSGGMATIVAGALFLAGVCLHLFEVHAHLHSHEPLEHEHPHRHDDGHHDHEHDPPVSGEHVHAHVHDGRSHSHPHDLDLHHRHAHGHG